MCRDGGGAKIDGKTVKRALEKSGPNVNHTLGAVIGAVQCDCDGPLALAKTFLQLMQNFKIGLYVIDIPLIC